MGRPNRFTGSASPCARKAWGRSIPTWANTLNNLGALYWEQGKIAEAEPLYQRALFIKERTLGPDDPALAPSLNNLAALYVRQGKYPEGESLFKRALSIRQSGLWA